jgi:DivIVA domain-containing protein
LRARLCDGVPGRRRGTPDDRAWHDAPAGVPVQEALVVLVLLILCLVVLVLAGVVVAVLRDEGPLLHEVERDLPGDGMPTDRPMTGDDVHGLKFTVALRGYRMADVDVALNRLAQELSERDAMIERLRAGADEQPATRTRQENGPPPLGAGLDQTMETETSHGSAHGGGPA